MNILEKNSELSVALQQVMQGLEDPLNYYQIKAHCYEEQGITWYLAIFCIHQTAIKSVDLKNDALLLNILNEKKSIERSSKIKLPLEHIWQIKRSSTSIFENTQDIVFFSQATFDRYPLAEACI